MYYYDVCMCDTFHVKTQKISTNATRLNTRHIVVYLLIYTRYMVQKLSIERVPDGAKSTAI